MTLAEPATMSDATRPPMHRLAGDAAPSAAPRDGEVLCKLAELPDPGARGVPHRGIFVVRHGRRVRAWRDACPHHGDTPLAWRRDAYLNADASRIVCAAHGAQFLPDSGLCVLGPCLGRSLTPVAVTLTAAGAIELDPSPLQEQTP